MERSRSRSNSRARKKLVPSMTRAITPVKARVSRRRIGNRDSSGPAFARGDDTTSPGGSVRQANPAHDPSHAFRLAGQPDQLARERKQRDHGFAPLREDEDVVPVTRVRSID